jgi:hypothetical protein
MISLNVIAAVILIVLGSMAVAAHRTHAYSTYRELQDRQVLVERPDYNVEQRLRTIANGGKYSLVIGRVAAGIFLLNAVAIWLFWPSKPTG